MKTKTIIFLLLLIIFQHCKEFQQGNDEWIKLFNGKDLNDWIVKIHHYEAGDNSDNTFRVKDEMIQVRYDNYGAYNDRFGHLYYKTRSHVFI